MTEEEMEEVLDDVTYYVDTSCENPDTQTPAESVELYEAIAEHCQDRARLIRSEMA